MTTSNATPSAGPSAADVQRVLAAELSRPSRLWYTLLLLTSLAGAGVVGALLATEPALPTRTRVALLILFAIGLSWSAFAVWVLRHRRVLLADHAVVASRLAVAFTTLFTLGALAAVVVGGGAAAALAAALGALMLAAAVTLLVRARRRVRHLSARRRDIEREMRNAAMG